MQIPWIEIIIAIFTVATSVGGITWIMAKGFGLAQSSYKTSANPTIFENRTAAHDEAHLFVDQGGRTYEQGQEFAAVRKEMAGGFADIRGEMAEEFKLVRADLRCLDSRVARIEGYITGRDYGEHKKIS
jgi:hypothetical protein